MIFHRTPLDTVTLTGSPNEVAFALGKMRRKQIEARIEHWNKTVAQLFRGKRDKLKSLEKMFLAAGCDSQPNFVEEILAMAEGAGVDFKDLFRVNLTELKPYAEKCTTLILPVTHGGKKRILIAHNEDWEVGQNDVFILRVKLPDVSYAIVTYDGYLPGLSSGFNSHGLYHAVNYVLAKDIRPGVPRAFITRYLVTAKSSADCLKWIRNTPRAFGQSIHLAENDHYTGIELTAKRVVVRKLSLPTLHANHYLSPALKKWAAAPSENSFQRQATGNSLVAKLKSKMPKNGLNRNAAFLAAKKILSDRSGLPYAIWRNVDSPKEASATVASILLLTGDDQMEVYRDKPDSGKALSVTCP